MANELAAFSNEIAAVVEGAGRAVVAGLAAWLPALTAAQEDPASVLSRE